MLVRLLAQTFQSFYYVIIELRFGEHSHCAILVFVVHCSFGDTIFALIIAEAIPGLASAATMTPRFAFATVPVISAAVSGTVPPVVRDCKA